jgi:hypothetical protein
VCAHASCAGWKLPARLLCRFGGWRHVQIWCCRQLRFVRKALSQRVFRIVKYCLRWLPGSCALLLACGTCDLLQLCGRRTQHVCGAMTRLQLAASSCLHTPRADCGGCRHARATAADAFARTGRRLLPRTRAHPAACSMVYYVSCFYPRDRTQVPMTAIVMVSDCVPLEQPGATRAL